MGDATDRQLWDQALLDDPEVFGTIFERHAKPVDNYLFRRSPDWSLAEDLTSIVFLEAWRPRRDVELLHDSALPIRPAGTPERRHGPPEGTPERRRTR